MFVWYELLVQPWPLWNCRSWM